MYEFLTSDLKHWWHFNQFILESRQMFVQTLTCCSETENSAFPVLGLVSLLNLLLCFETTFLKSKTCIFKSSHRLYEHRSAGDATNREAQWGISCIFSTPRHTAEFESLCFRAYPRISAWKSSFCPGRPRVHWALPNRDCVTAGNFWFCFVHRSRRITSSGTHLTRLPLLRCPPLNPVQ